MSDTAEHIAVEAVQTTTEAVNDAERAAGEAREAAAQAISSVADVVPLAASASADAMAELLAPIMDRLDGIEARLASLTAAPAGEGGEGAAGEGAAGSDETIVQPVEDAVSDTGDLAVVGVEEPARVARKATRFYRI